MAKETARSADPPKRHAPPAGWPAFAGHPPAQDAGREKGQRSGTEPSKRAKGLARPWRGSAGLCAVEYCAQWRVWLSSPIRD